MEAWPEALPNFCGRTLIRIGYFGGAFGYYDKNHGVSPGQFFADWIVQPVMVIAIVIQNSFEFFLAFDPSCAATVTFT